MLRGICKERIKIKLQKAQSVSPKKNYIFILVQAVLVYDALRNLILKTSMDLTRKKNIHIKAQRALLKKIKYSFY